MLSQYLNIGIGNLFTIVKNKLKKLQLARRPLHLVEYVNLI